MGLQNLLLGLGTALVAVSVVVFTAVNWSRLDASVQGLLLVAVTIAAGVATSLAARRAMPSTAEALGTVTVLLALADVHACRVGFAPAADRSLFWAAGFGIVGLLAAALGRAGSIRSPQILAGLLIQLPLLCLLDAAHASFWTAQLASVVQAAVVLEVAGRLDAPRWARRVAAGWALAVVALLTTATVLGSILGRLLEEGDPHDGATAVCSLAAALVALQLAWRRAASSQVRVVGLLAATGLGLTAVWFAGIEAFTVGTSIGMVALAAALVVLVVRELPDEWSDAPTVMAGIVGLAAVLPLLGAVASMLTAASVVGADAWHRSASQTAADFQLAEASTYAASGLGLQLAAVAVFVVALGRRGSRLAAGLAAAVVALAALILSPLLAPLTITETVALALGVAGVGVAIAAVLGARGAGFVVAAGFAALAVGWATPWSLATPSLTLSTLGVGVVGALVIAAVARRDDAAEAGAAAMGWAVGGATIFAGLLIWDAGTSAAMAWAVAATTAAVLSVVGVLLLDPRASAVGATRAMRHAVEASGLVAYLVALVGCVCLADPDAASVALAAGAVGFGLHAVRPRRGLLGLAAGFELLVLTWLRLAQADVALVEAYTLPLAVVLLVAGIVGPRLDRTDRGDVPSWLAFGPALVVGLGPTVWLAFTEPGTIRPLAGLVSGAVVLVVGVAWGKRALVDVGTGTVVALGLRQLAPVVGEVPNWVTIGATGVLLILVGATFEQRRRDLKAVLRRYAALT